MPKGVICGGAVDGSNQLGETVTNHAMTARPDGAGAPAVAAVATRQMIDASCKRTNARSLRMIRDCFMGPSTLMNAWPLGRIDPSFASVDSIHPRRMRCVGSRIIRR